jgi:small GTP-binding protein
LLKIFSNIPRGKVPLAILVKIILMGDGAVGKTSLKNKFMGRGFPSDYLPTLGSDFVTKTKVIQTDTIKKEFKYQIWDIAGQPSFKQIRTRFYNQAIGALLIFDVTREETLYNLENWIEELSLHAKRDFVSVYLIANKIDIREKKHLFNEKISSFIQKKLNSRYNNIEKDISFIETSAKTGENVEKAFNHLGIKILEYLY